MKYPEKNVESLSNANTTKESESMLRDGEPVVKVRNLVKNYEKVEALKGIDLDVHEGELFALLGPNGAGKTTLFSILSTLRKATSGSAAILGLDTQTEREAVRQKIGIVFQEPALDDRLPAWENLRLMALFYGIPWKAAKQRTEEIIDILGIRDFVERPPKQLSGGQKRKLELARSLVADPQLLFLDEATLGLDVDSRRNFWRTVRGLTKEGRTVFFTTHYMEEAEVADRIALISEGEIIALGSPQSLKNRIGGGLIRLKTESNDETKSWLNTNGYSAESEENELMVVAEEPAELLPALLQEIPHKIIRAEIREPSLEDVFLTLTGKSLDEDEAVEEALKQKADTGEGN